MRSTRAEREERINVIYSLICQGQRFSDIKRFCEKEYNIKQFATKKLFNSALERVREINIDNFVEIKKKSMARYEELYRLAVKNHDYKTAAFIQSRIDKINGLEVIKVVADINVDATIKKIDAIIREN